MQPGEDDEAISSADDAASRCRSCDPGGLPPGSTPPVRSVTRAFASQRSPASAAVRRPRTAWRRRGSPRDGNFCVIRQLESVALQGRRAAAPAAGPTVPISLDQMTLRRWGPPRRLAARPQRVRSADDRVHPVSADSDTVPAAKLNKEAWSDGDQPASPTAAWLATP